MVQGVKFSEPVHNPCPARSAIYVHVGHETIGGPTCFKNSWSKTSLIQ
jgi:hypothetical protein